MFNILSYLLTWNQTKNSLAPDAVSRVNYKEASVIKKN